MPPLSQNEDLFFPAESDDEDDLPVALDPSTEVQLDNFRNGDDEVPAVRATGVGPRSRTPLFALGDDFIALDDTDEPSSQLMSSAPTPSSAATGAAGPSSSASTSKRRPAPRSSPKSTVRDGFERGYLGEFVCEGWSLSKGRGYCSPGSVVVFERPQQRTASSGGEAKLSGSGAATLQANIGPARLVNGKVVPAKAKPPPGGRQMTLGAMGMVKRVPAPTRKGSSAKATADQIIRFRNERGFVGRLSVSEAGFLVHLLDTGVIELEGHVIDCPQVLATGSTILLNVKVYLARKGFEKVEKKDRSETGTFWQEQQETAEEEAMRNRKDALGSLFSRIGVKPVQSNALLLAQKKAGSSAASINPASLKHFQSGSQQPKQPTTVRTKRSPSPSKGSISSGGGGGKQKGNESSTRNSDDEDEDEDSGDEAEKLNEEQMSELDTIYRKAQMGDAKLEETDPPESFLYTLRPYQKQALTWMNARETGADNLRDSNQTLHPLWEEYAFRKEQAVGEPIEIEDDDDFVDPSRKFFWNPYSGELSLEFPRSQTKARGGILADAMGMGKTCMMASLIHLNREGEAATSPAPTSANDDDETAAASGKRRKFVQVTLSNQWRAVATAPKPIVKPTPRATLVVCPVSLASQWQDELGKMSLRGSIASFLWYGNDRADIGRLLAQEGKKRVDVIITSYGTLVSEHARWRKNKDKLSGDIGGSVFDHEFLRIVLDEAHNIKNRTAQVSKACYDLKAERRWALTGTPIVNRLDDLYSLLHFVRLEPWGHYSFFRSFVTIPFLNQDPKALNVVQYILESCLLRREKNMRDRDGKLIVDLPTKTVDVQVLNFSRPERQIYKQLEDKAKRRFIELDAEGRAMSNYTSILAMLMKLRQCVDHPLLVMSKGSDDDRGGDQLLDADDGETSLKQMIASYAGGKGEADANFSDENSNVDQAYARQVLQELAEAESTPECLICFGEVFDEVLLPCYHRGCQDCIVEYIGHCEDTGRQAACPTCDKGPLRLTDLRSVQRRRKRANPLTAKANNDLPPSQGEAVTIGKVDLVSSTKLRALVRKLEQMRQAEPTYKALVFSQFTSFLDLIETTLSKEGVRWLRFDGSMSQAQRAATVEEFGEKNTEPVVLLISLKAGGVGLNLTAANHVFMMDTWWNEAIEQQAIDRVHRLGQTMPVYVTRYIIKGTVEKRIMKIQRTKTALVNASLSGGAAKDKQATLADIKKIFGLGGEDSEDEVY